MAIVMHKIDYGLLVERLGDLGGVDEFCRRAGRSQSWSSYILGKAREGQGVTRRTLFSVCDALGCLPQDIKPTKEAA
jgi:hypothetical protein